MHEFYRTEKLIGKDNLDKINKSKVLVIGIGGVGGSAVISLARSGIKNIIIIDNDIVEETNINRQAIAYSSTIGKYKTDIMKSILLDINKDINVVTINKFVDDSNIDEIFNLDFDYLIDACDTLNTKKLLIKNCINKNKIFISCMGTALKLDPSKLNITYLDKTEYDPIAKILRRWAKSENINKRIPVVSSNEKAIKNNDNILSSMCFVPNTAGILCAKYIIDKIIDL